MITRSCTTTHTFSIAHIFQSGFHSRSVSFLGAKCLKKFRARKIHNTGCREGNYFLSSIHSEHHVAWHHVQQTVTTRFSIFVFHYARVVQKRHRPEPNSGYLQRAVRMSSWNILSLYEDHRLSSSLSELISLMVDGISETKKSDNGEFSNRGYTNRWSAMRNNTWCNRGVANGITSKLQPQDAEITLVNERIRLKYTLSFMSAVAIYVPWKKCETWQAGLHIGPVLILGHPHCLGQHQYYDCHEESYGYEGVTMALASETPTAFTWTLQGR